MRAQTVRVKLAGNSGSWRLGHRPALDGLRAVAIGMVICAHSYPNNPYALGLNGVTVFFTLSGFLITSLLLEERSRSGRIDMPGFYRRRALRLLPALVVLVAALLTFSATTLGGAVRVLLYVGNWAQVNPDHGLGLASHTWSLGIEEQFYILWPLVAIVLVRFGSRAVLWAAVLGAAASAVARAAVWDGSMESVRRIYFGSDMHADALLIGCALAALLHGRHATDRRRPATVAACLLLVAALGATTGPLTYIVGMMLVPLLTAVVIGCTVTGTRSRLLESRALVFVGRRSYGLYLWHYPIFFAGLPVLDDHVSHLVAVAVVLAVSLLVTEASWRWVEQPFLRRRAAGRPAAASNPPRSVAYADGAVE